MKNVAGALANLARDEKCSMDVVAVGGVHALATLARTCKDKEVQKNAVSALSNFAAYGENHSNNIAVGQDAGALREIVQLTQSPHGSVREAANTALWNLCSTVQNRNAIAGIDGGPDALLRLIRLAQRTDFVLPKDKEMAHEE